MVTRVEAEFDPLSGAFAASSGGLFGDSDEDKEVAPITSKPLAASSGGLFDDSDEEKDPNPPSPSPTPPPPAPVVKLKTADLSQTKIIKEKQSTKKKKPIQQHKTTNNALFGGAADNDEDDIFSSLRPKIEQGTLDSFLSSDGTTTQDNEEEVSGGLFDDSDEDKEEEEEGRTGRTGRTTKGTGAYLKRMLQEDNEEEDYSDLKVAGLISTDVDNAGGLLEEGQGIEQAKKDAMDTTDASLLAVREDDDLESLMAATQVNTIDVTKQEDKEEEDIFKVSDNTNNDEDDDDLFSMMGMGGDDEAGGGDGGDDLSSIDAYISKSSGGGGGLFD